MGRCGWENGSPAHTGALEEENERIRSLFEIVHRDGEREDGGHPHPWNFAWGLEDRKTGPLLEIVHKE